MNDKKPTVVIIGRNYCNILTMTRALGEAGYDVEVLRVFKTKPSRINFLRRMKPDAYSKYVKIFHECIAHNNPETVVNYLLDIADADEKRLLLPVDDYTVCVADENYDRLCEHYIVPNIGTQASEITRLMDKAEQKRLAAEFDLPLLRSILIKSKNGKFEIPRDVPYPCFVKPNVSMKSTKAKMTKCDNEEELNRVLTGYAKSEDFEMLVEEFADIKAEYSILGICTADGITAPGLFKAIEGGHRERKGVALIGEMIPCTHLQKIIDECNKFIQSLDYTGMFDVDLIETTDGKVYFVELNFRAGASTHALTKTGVNLPGMFADNVVKSIPLKTDCIVKETGRKFISEKVLMEEYVRNDVTLAKVRKSMREVDIFFVKDDSDPKPYNYFKKFYPAATLLRIPYRIRDRRKK